MLLPTQPVYDTTTGNIVCRAHKSWFGASSLENKHIYQDKTWIVMVDTRIEGSIQDKIIVKFTKSLFEGIRKGYIKGYTDRIIELV